MYCRYDANLTSKITLTVSKDILSCTHIYNRKPRYTSMEIEIDLRRSPILLDSKPDVVPSRPNT